jgi:MOSC domain-containing protein YiiM
VKWPGLLRYLHEAHEQNFGINARVVTGGRIEAGEAVELVPTSGFAAGGR